MYSNGNQHQSHGLTPSKIPGQTTTRNRDGTGIRYITEDMIKKVAKNEHLEVITSVNLTLAKEGGKKIKYIENLDRLKKLQILNLSCNVIEKIEKLDKLTRLRELNLSFNCLIKIEGLETLSSLQILNLTGNEIEHIPAWIGKKLKALRTLKLAKNQLQSLQQLTKLRPLKDLTCLTVQENPVAALPHCRLFLVFHLRTVESLDSSPITVVERNAAKSRFAQEEIEHLEHLLEQHDVALAKLQEEHNKSLHELEDYNRRNKETQQKFKNNQGKMKDLERELETKNDLLKRKTSELTRACEKHYELEQELAFYKIDHKFDTLSKPPKAPTPDSNESMDEGGLIGESAYIGKGRFREDQLARERILRQRRGEMGRPGSTESWSGSGEGGYLDPEAREKLHQQLDLELAEKRRAIDMAQDHLQQLQEDLVTTQDQLSQAAEDIQHLAQISPGRHLTEDDKQSMRNQLAKKMNKIQHLRGASHKIEKEMLRTQDEVKHQERDIGRLRGKLHRMGSKDSLYNLVKKEVADKELQLDLTNQEYHALQSQLEEMLATITREADDIKKLETELREGQAAQNEEIRDELNSVISGLQGYLKDVANKADKQKLDYDSLVRDREELLQRLRDLESERDIMEVRADEINHLKGEIAALENSLDNAKDMNESLQNQLEETRLRELDEAETSAQLHHAEDEVEKLKREVAEAERKEKSEQEKFQKVLEAEQKKLGYLKNKAKLADSKEDEIRNLHRELAELQAANAHLQDQLYSAQQKRKEEQKSSIHPDDLKRRLDEVTKAIRTGRGGIQPKKSSRDEATDPVEEALGEMQEKVQKEMERSFRDLEKANRAKSQMEQEVAVLRDQVTQVQDQEREMAEEAIQALLDDEKMESDRLRAEIARLRAELQRQKEKSNEHAIPVHLLQPTITTTTTTSDTETATETATTSSEESSTIPSSQWSKKRQELYDSMTMEEQELFDELQKEIEELRRLLGLRDGETAAAKKAEEISKKSEELRTMIEDRRRKRKDSESRTAATSTTGNTEATITKTKKRVYGDPKLSKAAEELARAQEEIDALQSELREKNQFIKNEIARNDKSDYTVSAQQDEIDAMHEVMEEQRAEIENLNLVLDRANGHALDQPGVYADQIQQIHRGVSDVRSRLAQHSPRIHDLTRSRAKGHEMRGHDPRGHPSRGHRQATAPGSETYVDTRGMPIPSTGDYEGHGAMGGGQIRQGPGSQGRPLPTFYNQGAQQQADPMYFPGGGNVPLPPGAGGGVGMSTQSTGMVPQGPALHPALVPGAPGAVGAFSTSGAPVMPGQSQALHPQLTGPFSVPGGPTTSTLQTGGQPLSSVPGQPGISVSYGPPGTLPGAVGSGHVTSSQMSQMAGPSYFPTMPGGPLPMASGPVPFGVGPTTPGGIPMAPTTPPGRPTQIYHPMGGMVSAPTTPVAGDGMSHTVSAVNTPGGPVMMSTPVGDLGGGGVIPVKGILKKGGQGASGVGVVTQGGPGVVTQGGPGTAEGIPATAALLCNVPEHHNLEDYISKLQAKLRSAKNKLRNEEDDSFIEESRKVLFEDDIDRRAVKRLQAELDARRTELEGLDLAIETQKSALKDMKYRERRDHGMVRDLRGRTMSVQSQKDYLLDEVACLEETLLKRRAELREADRLLLERETHLSEAKKEASETIRHYEEAKIGLKNTMRDADEIEKRTHEAGVNLVQTEENLQLLQLEIEDLQDTKAEKKNMLKEIEAVIERKDEEFNVIEAKIKEATIRFHHLSEDLSDADNRQRERIGLMAESDKIVSERRTELDSLRTQLEKNREEVDIMGKHLGKGHHELETLEDTIRRRREQLDSLDRDVEEEVQAKRRTLKELESEKRRLEQHLEDKRDTLHQVQCSIDHEEEVLQNLATLTNKHKAENVTVIEEIEKHSTMLGDLLKEQESKISQLEDFQNRISEEEQSLERLRSDHRKRQAESEQIRQQTDRERGELDALLKQKKSTENAITTYHRERAKLDEDQKAAQKKLSDMTRHYSEVEEAVNVRSQKLNTLDTEIHKVEVLLDDTRSEKSNMEYELAGLRTTISDSQSDLEDIQSNLQEAGDNVQRLERELDDLKARKEEGIKDLHIIEENLSLNEQALSTKTTELCHLTSQLSQMTADIAVKQDELNSIESLLGKVKHDMTLTERVKALAKEISKKDEERNRMKTSLEKSYHETKNLQLRMAKEMQYIREKSNKEIADLEGIAQAHYSRANRLSDELNYIRAEYLEAKRQLASQQEMAEREKRLEDALQEFKGELKEVLSQSMNDANRSQLDAVNELEQLHDQKDNLEHHLDSLRHSLKLIRRGVQDKPVPLIMKIPDGLPNSFVEQQDFLKQQLQRKMNHHAEMLQNQKQISQDSIQKLQNKLSNLEQVFSHNDTGHMSTASDIMSGPTKEVTSPTISMEPVHDSDPPSQDHSQESDTSSKDGRVPKHAYSPHRHSNKHRSHRITTNLNPAD